MYDCTLGNVCFEELSLNILPYFSDCLLCYCTTKCFGVEVRLFARLDDIIVLLILAYYPPALQMEFDNVSAISYITLLIDL